MPIIAAAIGAGALLTGDAISSAGQSATNADNAAINQQNINAAWARQQDAETFNAQQVQQQEQFQQQELGAVENYDTQMSNTAMQRRVADLNQAGINPLLAVSQGGASTPTVSAPSGTAASIGAAGQSSGIAMQNPNAAFGNLGGIVSTAAQTAQTEANINLLKAQTDEADADAHERIPEQTQYFASMTNLTNRQAEQAQAITQNIAQQIKGQELSNQQLQEITMPLQNVSLDVARATRDAMISASQSDATARQLNLQGLRNLNDVEQGNFGKTIAILNAILSPIHTASQVLK